MLVASQGRSVVVTDGRAHRPQRDFMREMLGAGFTFIYGGMI